MHFPHLHHSRKQFSVAAVCIVFLLTFIALSWGRDHQAQHLQASTEIEQYLDQVTAHMETHTQVYIQTLFGARGLMAGSTNVSRRDWSLFYNNIGVAKRLTGMAIIGYVEKVQPGDKASFVAQLRTDPDLNGSDFTTVSIHPQPELREQHIIKYIEPISPTVIKNSIGFDYSSEEVRWQTLQKARDTNQPVLTPPIKTLDTNQTAFLLMLAVYDPLLPRTTIEQRQYAYRGAVTMGFRTNEFFEQLFSEYQKEGIAIEVFDGEVISDEYRLYDSTQQRHVLGAEDSTNKITSLRRVSVADRVWTIRYTYDRPSPIWFLLPSLEARIALLVITNIITAMVVFHWQQLKKN